MVSEAVAAKHRNHALDSVRIHFANASSASVKKNVSVESSSAMRPSITAYPLSATPSAATYASRRPYSVRASSNVTSTVPRLNTTVTSLAATSVTPKKK